MRQRLSKDAWTAHVAAWRHSGLTAKVFAEQAGVKYKSFLHWKCRLDAEAQERDGAHNNPSPLSFVEIPRLALRESSANTIVVELRGGARVVVPDGVEQPMLTKLLRAIEQAAS